MPKRTVDWYGPRLRALREEKGWTQAELGRVVNLAGSQINKLETNISQPLLATALDIARALDLPLENFIPEDARTRLKDQPAAPSTPSAEDLQAERQRPHPQTPRSRAKRSAGEGRRQPSRRGPKGG